MSPSPKSYYKPLVIIVYLFSLLMCAVIISEPLIKKTEVLEFSDTLNNTDGEAGDSNKKEGNEENTGTPDYFLCSVYNMIHYPVLSIDRSFFDKEADSLKGYLDILSPPPKG